MYAFAGMYVLLLFSFFLFFLSVYITFSFLFSFSDFPDFFFFDSVPLCVWLLFHSISDHSISSIYLIPFHSISDYLIRSVYSILFYSIQFNRTYLIRSFWCDSIRPFNSSFVYPFNLSVLLDRLFRSFIHSVCSIGIIVWFDYFILAVVCCLLLRWLFFILSSVLVHYFGVFPLQRKFFWLYCDDSYETNDSVRNGFVPGVLIF